VNRSEGQIFKTTMAKCIITFEDGEEEGQVETRVEFDPPLDNPDHGNRPTPAQMMGWQFMQAVTSDAESIEETEE